MPHRTKRPNPVKQRAFIITHANCEYRATGSNILTKEGPPPPAPKVSNNISWRNLHGASRTLAPQQIEQRHVLQEKSMKIDKILPLHEQYIAIWAAIRVAIWVRKKNKVDSTDRETWAGKWRASCPVNPASTAERQTPLPESHQSSFSLATWQAVVTQRAESAHLKSAIAQDS